MIGDPNEKAQQLKFAGPTITQPIEYLKYVDTPTLNLRFELYIKFRLRLHIFAVHKD